MKKYLNFLFRDQLFFLLGIILLAMTVGCIVLGTVQRKYARELEHLKMEKALVLQIAGLEKKIHVQFPVSQSGLKIEGMLMQNGTATALINNSVYEVGDIVGDYQLLQINKNFLLFLNTRTNKNEEIIFREDPTEAMKKEEKKNI